MKQRNCEWFALKFLMSAEYLSPNPDGETGEFWLRKNLSKFSIVAFQIHLCECGRYQALLYKVNRISYLRKNLFPKGSFFSEG
jgi:hypothetical protein